MDWEKRFYDYCVKNNIGKTFSVNEGKLIVAFIRSQRSQLLKSLVEEVGGIKWFDDDDGGSMTANMGYNQALQDVIKLLEKYK